MTTLITNPPDPNDPPTFNARALLSWAQLAALAAELNVLGAQWEAASQTAMATVSAVKWVSGATVAQGAVVWSPSNGSNYRRVAATGSGTTDPGVDSSGAYVPVVPAAPRALNVSAQTSMAIPFRYHRLKFAGVSTISLPAAPAEDDIVWIRGANGLADNLIVRNGKNIAGRAEDLTMTFKDELVVLRYVASESNWELINV